MSYTMSTEARGDTRTLKPVKLCNLRNFATCETLQPRTLPTPPPL